MLNVMRSTFQVKHINDVMFIKDLSMLPQCNVTLEMYDHVYCMLVA